MLESFLETMKIVLLVTVAIPMVMGLVMSLFGFGVLEWTRFIERRSGTQSDQVPPSLTAADA
jgi:uncharacterized membrane protein YcfT